MTVAGLWRTLRDDDVSDAYKGFVYSADADAEADADACNVARVSFKVAGVSCNVAGVSCNVARVSCNITGNTCNITGNTCNITRNKCNITRVRLRVRVRRIHKAHISCNDSVIQLSPLSSYAVLEVEISRAWFVHFVLQYSQHFSQLDLNPANLKATLKAEWILAFLFLRKRHF